MWNRFSRVNAPAEPAVTLAEVKAHCDVTYTDDDTLITGLINAAIDVIDGPSGVGIALFEQQWKLTLDKFPSDQILIPMWPVTSIVSVKYLDDDGVLTTLDAADYRLDTARDPAVLEPALAESWPSVNGDLSSPIAIEFLAGRDDTADINSDLKLAIKMLVAHWYEHREATDTRLREIPYGVEMILMKYRRAFFG